MVKQRVMKTMYSFQLLKSEHRQNLMEFNNLRNLIHCGGDVKSKPEVLMGISTSHFHYRPVELTTNQFVAEVMDVPRAREPVVNSSGG